MPLKRFFEWIGLKKKLHFKGSFPPYVNEGDIWWASLGENVGSEINGKSGLFSRPVIIFKKLAHGFYLVVPTTTQGGTGSWYVTFKQHGRLMKACLHQVRTFDHRRLFSKIGRLDDADFLRIKEAFIDLYS